MSTEKISVVVPIYKVEEYLGECVDSLIRQTYSNIEIILVDDGSPDSCPQICDEYSVKDSRIKVVHKVNGGLSSARNAGINVATGSYIVFVDSDDFIAEDMIEYLLKISLKEDADIVSCRLADDRQYLKWGEALDVELFSPEKVIKLMLTEQKITTCAVAKLYKIDLFAHIRFPEGKIYEDLGTIYKVVDKANRIAFADIQKYFYRYNSESITHSRFNNRHMDYYDVFNQLREYVVEKYPECVRLVDNHATRISIAFYRQISACGFDDEGTILFLLRFIRKHIGHYMFSRFAFLSKMYGLVISIMPKVALKVFAK